MYITLLTLLTIWSELVADGDLSPILSYGLAFGWMWAVINQYTNNGSYLGIIICLFNFWVYFRMAVIDTILEYRYTDHVY